MSAIDMTSLLLEVSVPMKQLYPSMPSKVLEALCYAIAGVQLYPIVVVCVYALAAVATLYAAWRCLCVLCVCVHTLDTLLYAVKVNVNS
jgi:hypothetical protein